VFLPYLDYLRHDIDFPIQRAASAAARSAVRCMLMLDRFIKGSILL
jgi:hypothetical protein